ncbi:MAG: CoA pyrophosphatase [Syntrophomonas sp.]|nr:CoA pyrophosphatase [Syntrophomonas sp.]
MLDKGIEALRGRKPNILEHELASKSAVLLPMVKVQQETCILFEKRSSLLKHQPGEICFPGGGIESSDRGTAIAAVRETCEELGLMTEDIELIAPLDIMVTPFNVIIYPYVGYIKDFSKVQPNCDEVEEVFYVPVNFLLKNKPIFKKLSLKMDAPEDFPFELIPHGKDYPFRKASYPQHFYIWKDRVIWGMTARILNHFLHLLNCDKPKK